MKNMKKIIVIVLSIFCIMGLASCTDDDTGNECIADPACAEPAGKLSDNPPTLTITCGQLSIEALTGGFSWGERKAGDITSTVIACGAHPLQCRDITPVLTVSGDDTASLTFGEAPVPDELTITCYDSDAWDDMEAKGKDFDVMTSIPPEIKLEGNGAIYVIGAKWTNQDNYGGSVEYSFCTE